jgi:hypothetical protein
MEVEPRCNGARRFVNLPTKVQVVVILSKREGSRFFACAGETPGSSSLRFSE